MKEKEIVDKTLAGENVLKAMDKLKKEKVEISINPKKYLLDYSKEELKKLEDMKTEGMNEGELKVVEQAKENLRQSINRYSEAKLEAVMVPLRYKELQAIKDGVLEAIKFAQQFNWDDDIKMRAMLREEHTLTVFLSLKKKDKLNERYYSKLEDIAQETESTIDELYNVYLTNFVLSEEERKNF
jgi:hypothetical protein